MTTTTIPLPISSVSGCGKKRSEPKVEPLSSGAELDALAKHVVAEAKLWEQLQNKVGRESVYLSAFLRFDVVI